MPDNKIQILKIYTYKCNKSLQDYHQNISNGSICKVGSQVTLSLYLSVHYVAYMSMYYIYDQKMKTMKLPEYKICLYTHYLKSKLINDPNT